MCRPNYSQWVIPSRYVQDGEPVVFAIQGEGSHSHIMHKEKLEPGRRLMIGRPLGGDGIIFSDDGPTIASTITCSAAIIDITAEKLLPMECIWSESPEIKLQPNTNRFYGRHELPTEKDWNAAQRKLDEDIGDIHLLANWLVDACKLYFKEGDYASVYPNLSTSKLNWVDFMNPGVENYSVIGELCKLMGDEGLQIMRNFCNEYKVDTNNLSLSNCPASVVLPGVGRVTFGDKSEPACESQFINEQVAFDFISYSYDNMKKHPEKLPITWQARA